MLPARGLPVNRSPRGVADGLRDIGLDPGHYTVFDGGFIDSCSDGAQVPNIRQQRIYQILGVASAFPGLAAWHRPR